MDTGFASTTRKAELAQLVARRSHNPKVVSSILTLRMGVPSVGIGNLECGFSGNRENAAGHLPPDPPYPRQVVSRNS